MRDMWIACADGAVGTQGRARGACKDLAGGAASDSREIEEWLGGGGGGVGGSPGGGGGGGGGRGGQSTLPP
jgi:hypothetical protein